MELHYKFNTKALVLASMGMIMLFTSIMTFTYDPLKLIVKTFLDLKPGTIFFNIWSIPPYEVLIKLYVFNVTNSKEFYSGTDQKINFTEVGPYIYKEILTNENATFNEDGTVTFYPRRKVVFDDVRSPRDPFIDTVISPNIPLLGIQASLNDAAFYTNMAFASFSSAVGADPFKNLTVDQYLWGYEDRLVELANKFVPSWIDFQKFGIFDRLMTVDNGNIVKIAALPDKDKNPNILLTEEEKSTRYHIVEWNGSPGLKEWGYEKTNNESTSGNKKCQLVAGAMEGTIFPNYMDTNKTFKVFRKAFCRPVPLKFFNKGLDENGFEAFNFKIPKSFLASPENNPENSCFCYKNKCLADGLGHMAPCYYDIPIVMSQPHFFNGAPWLVTQVNGIEPIEELHDSLAQVQPQLGVPLNGHLRIQINLDIGATRFNIKTKPFNDLVLPLFWLELTVAETPPIIYFLINLVTLQLPIAQKVFMYLFGLVGLALISSSALIFLVLNRPTINGTISLKGDYSAVPIITIPQKYFKPDFRISKG